MNDTVKCAWSLKTDLEEIYHDSEWGVPVFDDRALFEMLSLELCQSGLSWYTVLKKRKGFQKAFDHFNVKKIAQYSDRKKEELLGNADIIRHKAKIAAIINNAKCFIDIQNEYGSFSDYIWGFVDNNPLVGNWKDEGEVPASTELSDMISKDLKKRGFKFLGTTTVYAFLQSVGVVNDHVTKCFRFDKCK